MRVRDSQENYLEIHILTMIHQIQQLQIPSVGGVTNKDLCIWTSGFSPKTPWAVRAGSHWVCAVLLFCSSSIVKGQGTWGEKDTWEDFPPTTRTKRAISLISLQVHNLIYNSKIISENQQIFQTKFESKTWLELTRGCFQSFLYST